MKEEKYMEPQLEPLKGKPPLPPHSDTQVQGEEKESQSVIQAVHKQLEKNSYEDFYPARIQTKEVDIDRIKHNENLIPDYKKPFSLLWPVVVTDIEEDTYHCIDGWSRIEEAREEGKKTIECDVHYVHRVSDSVIVLKKTAIRMTSRSGMSYYAENIRNVKNSLYYLIEFFDRNGKEPYLFFHGGPRKSESYAKNKENDIRQLLADYLNKSRDTLNVYIKHGEYLNCDILEILVEEEARSRFFQRIRKDKNKLVMKLIAEGTPYKKIEEEVSKNVLEWLEQYGPHGKGKKAASQAPDSDDETEELSKELKEFKPFSPDDIKSLEKEVIENSKKLKEFIADFTPTKNNFIKELPVHITEIEGKIEHIKDMLEKLRRQYDSGTIH